MFRLFKTVAIVVAVVIAAVVLAIPRLAPPVVERFAAGELRKLGVPASVGLSLGYCWRNGPGIEGRLRAEVFGTPWRVRVEFGASCCEWFAAVTMPETTFSETDPLMRKLLGDHPISGVSNLVFSGSVALDAKVERTFRRPMPFWSVTVPLKDVCARMMSEAGEIAVMGLSARPCASGIAEHVDIRPIFPRAACLKIGDFGITNFHATVQMTEKAVIVSEAGAGFCGGKVNVYSLYLDAEKLDTGFTLFLEDVDAGEALSHVNGFHGEASGRLHGKVKAFVREGGKSVRLGDMFLYSTPGETGKLRIDNPEPVTRNLAYAGLDDDARANVANALTDLDYKVLRMDLRRTDAKSARLSIRVGGTATRGKTTVPVDLTINLNGEIEQLLNSGLGYSSKLKGRKK